jgi:hypothetical protein
MKKRLVCLALLLSLSLRLSAQDRLITRTNDTVRCVVMSFDAGFIRYKTDTLATTVEMVAVTNVKAILFAVNPLRGTAFPVVQGADDWEKVILTNNPNDVLGLTKVAEISSRTRSNLGSPGYGSKKVRRDLQQRAAELNCSVVFLIGYKQVKWGGKFVGTAYR